MYSRVQGSLWQPFSKPPAPQNSFYPFVCSNHQPACITCRRPKAGPVPSPPWEADPASNPESTASRVPTAFQVCSFPWLDMSDTEEVGCTLALLWIAPTRSANSDHTTIEEEAENCSELWHHIASPAEPPLRPFTDKNQTPKQELTPLHWEQKAPGGREISMVHDTQPTHYELLGFEPTPRSPQAGCMPTMILRQCGKPTQWGGGWALGGGGGRGGAGSAMPAILIRLNKIMAAFCPIIALHFGPQH